MAEITITCGYCGVLGSGYVSGHSEGKVSFLGHILVKCVSCSSGNLLTVFSDVKSDYNNSFVSITEILDTQTNVTDNLDLNRQLPTLEIKLPTGMPLKVHSVYEDAERTYRANIWNPAALQYRKVLEQACKDKGQIAGNLYQKIEALRAADLITENLKDWAHEIRTIGNEAAHQDPLPIEDAKIEAEDIRNFAELFMTYLYTLPMKLEERRTKTAGDSNAP